MPHRHRTAELIVLFGLVLGLSGCASTPVTSPAPATPQPAPAIAPDILAAAGAWWITAAADSGVLLCLETAPTAEAATFNCVTVADLREYITLQGTDRQ